MGKTVVVGMPSLESLVDFPGKAIRRERQELINQFERLAIPYVLVKERWPRDYFVLYQDKLYSEQEHGHYADGGYVLTNDRVTFICSEVSRGMNGRPLHSIEKRTQKIIDLYGKNIFVLPSPDLSRHRFMSPHLDLVLLPIPQRDLLVVDALYYRKNHDALDRLAERYHFSVKLVEHDDTRPSWPCNSLLYEHEDKLFVFTNSTHNKGFMHLLQDYGLHPVGIPFYHNTAIGGSVHCATNILPKEFSLQNLPKYDLHLL